MAKSPLNDFKIVSVGGVNPIAGSPGGCVVCPDVIHMGKPETSQP